MVKFGGWWRLSPSCLAAPWRQVNSNHFTTQARNKWRETVGAEFGETSKAAGEPRCKHGVNHGVNHGVDHGKPSENLGVVSDLLLLSPHGKLLPGLPTLPTYLATYLPTYILYIHTYLSTTPNVDGLKPPNSQSTLQSHVVAMSLWWLSLILSLKPEGSLLKKIPMDPDGFWFRLISPMILWSIVEWWKSVNITHQKCFIDLIDPHINERFIIIHQITSFHMNQKETTLY